MSIKYPKLNFPNYSFRVKKNTKGEDCIFDVCRKKFVLLTPEEWVRQNVVSFLHIERKFPLSLFAIERMLKLNNTIKRTDVLIYTTDLKPFLIVECKAPDVKINQQVLDQAARYNLVYGVRYVILTNGIVHFCCELGSDGGINVLSDFPFHMRH